MRSLVEKYKDEDFAVVGVNSDRERWIPEYLIEKGKVTWRSFQDAASAPKISTQWQIDRWPTFMLIDKRGVITRINAEHTLLTKEIERILAGIQVVEGEVQ